MNLGFNCSFNIYRRPWTVDREAPMKHQLKNLPSLAKSREAETKQYFNKLKRRKSAELDDTVAGIHEQVFAETDCLKCANCCITTGPLFTQRDMDRIAKHLSIKTGEFIQRYLYMDEDGDFVLKQVPCTFLGDDNRCSIYEVRPQACREYPHTDHTNFHQILDLTLKNTFICPAAYEVIERLKKALPM